METWGITEKGDSSLDSGWKDWCNKGLSTILITKNVKKLFMENKNLFTKHNTIIHATITGNGGTVVEPNVPEPKILQEYIEKRVPKSFWEYIVIRVDPIIPIIENIQNSYNVYKWADNLGFRTKVSILDLYPHCYHRWPKDILAKLNEFDIEDHIHFPYEIRKAILDKFPNASVCGEPGFYCEWCISQKDYDILGIMKKVSEPESKQREFCHCAGVKKELLSGNSCSHGCLYCYRKCDVEK